MGRHRADDSPRKGNNELAGWGGFTAVVCAVAMVINGAPAGVTAAVTGTVVVLFALLWYLARRGDALRAVQEPGALPAAQPATPAADTAAPPAAAQAITVPAVAATNTVPAVAAPDTNAAAAPEAAPAARDALPPAPEAHPLTRRSARYAAEHRSGRRARGRAQV